MIRNAINCAYEVQTGLSQFLPAHQLAYTQHIAQQYGFDGSTIVARIRR
jgi:hypothetical protein